MIIKTKRLKSIGKFYDFAAQANALDWHKNTFVVAPNAYGKSTLVNVLRSLRDNDPKLIRARKTLGAVAAPEAVIVIDSAIHIFNGTGWNKPFPAIQFFDAPFIHANILTHEIGHEHKKNIHKIIIGAQGIKVADELAALKTKEKDKKARKSRISLVNSAGADLLSRWMHSSRSLPKRKPPLSSAFRNWNRISSPRNPRPLSRDSASPDRRLPHHSIYPPQERLSPRNWPPLTKRPRSRSFLTLTAISKTRVRQGRSFGRDLTFCRRIAPSAGKT